MINYEIEINSDEFEDKIIPILLGEVFHITSYKNYEDILKSGSIKANLYLNNKPTFPQSEGSYYSKKGYISLFDGRIHKGKLGDTIKNTLKEGLEKFQYGKMFSREKTVIIFLSNSLYKDLDETDRKNTNGATIIPYVEVGYKDTIPVNKFKKIVVIINKKYQP